MNILVLNESKEMATSLRDTGIGEVDRAEICQELSKLTGRKRRPLSKYYDEDRYTIAKYDKDSGASQAAKFFKNKYPTISECTVRTFVKKYDENLKVAKACGRSPNRKLKTFVCRRPLMVGPIIDEKVRKFMVSLYKKGGHVSRSLAATTAIFLLSRTGDESVKNVVVTTTWGKSLLQRIGFRRRAATTSKVEIRDSTKKGAGLQHHRIPSIVEKHKIPESLMINSDQTLSKYVQVGRFTMAPKGTKKNITLTLTVTMDGKALPFQAIYKGKTKQSLPKGTFPTGFRLSANMKHHINTQEV